VDEVRRIAHRTGRIASVISGVVVGLFSGVGAVALNYLALMKRLPPDERARWNRLPLSTRTSVAKAVRKGCAPDDQRLALIAAELAASRRPGRVATGVLAAISCLFLASAALLAVDGPPAMAFASACVALWLGSLGAYVLPRQRARLARAETQSRALAALTDRATDD
jgi:hypothetical protein